MPLPGAAKELFKTNNSGASCAAFSQTWLVLSLIQGAPLEKPGIVQNQGMMKKFQKGENLQTGDKDYVGTGAPSLQALPSSGLAVSGNVIVLNNTAWSSIFQSLANCAPGFYYITMKQPHHANACYIANSGEFYYLEPEEGCYKYSDANSLTASLPGWYQTRTGQSTNTEFKIYPVDAA